jgi:hypothetical protein
MTYDLTKLSDAELKQLATIAEAEDTIKRFSLTASLGNPASMRTVDEAREKLAVAQRELAEHTNHERN